MKISKWLVSSAFTSALLVAGLNTNAMQPKSDIVDTAIAAASKAAQDNLTFSFSAKLGPKVKVNSLAPALVLFNEDDGEANKQKTLEKSLMRREGGLEEFQHAIDYLLGSGYVTGRVLPMDGGRHPR